MEGTQFKTVTCKDCGNPRILQFVGNEPKKCACRLIGQVRTLKMDMVFYMSPEWDSIASFVVGDQFVVSTTYFKNWTQFLTLIVAVAEDGVGRTVNITSASIDVFFVPIG